MSVGGHTCNAGCRDGRHCHLFYGAKGSTGDLVAAELRVAFAHFGQRIVAVEPAREAPPVSAVGRAAWQSVVAGTAKGHYGEPPAPDDCYDPFLIFFEEQGP